MIFALLFNPRTLLKRAAAGSAAGAMVIILMAVPGAADPEPPPNKYPRFQTGRASFYADRFQNRKTASGERYDRNQLTSAHRFYPFGTRVRVVRPDTGRSVVVRINDRGPRSPDRIIDLSRKAAETLGLSKRGVVKVRLEVLNFGGKS